MKSYIKFALNFTTSKLLSYIILIVGAGFAFYTKDKSVMTETMMWSALLQGTKAVAERFKNDK